MKYYQHITNGDVISKFNYNTLPYHLKHLYHPVNDEQTDPIDVLADIIELSETLISFGDDTSSQSNNFDFGGGDSGGAGAGGDW